MYDGLCCISYFNTVFILDCALAKHVDTKCIVETARYLSDIGLRDMGELFMLRANNRQTSQFIL